jgi:imidazolonepropionase-like amidohydrolase
MKIPCITDFSLSVALSFSLLVATLLHAADDDTFLLKGATIHTMAGKDIVNGSILVRGGKIAGVGQDLAAPGGVKVIDASGMQVYPGIIDSGTSVGLTEISGVRETSDAQELGKFNPQLRASVAVNPDSEHIPVTRANGITAVLAMPEGTGLSGQASLIHLDGWTTDELEVKRSAAMHLHMPTIGTTGFRGGGGGGDAEDPTGAPRITFEQMKQNYDKEMVDLNNFFEDARRYARAKETAAADFKIDLKLEAMLPVIKGEEPLLITAQRERAIRDALQFADKQKIRMILCDPKEAYKVLDEIKSHNVPVIMGPTLSLPVTEDDPYDQPFATPGQLYKAGIKFAFASFSNQFSRDLPYQAAAAVPFGLPKEEAMRAITVNAAQILGVANQMGTIEEGKFADFMVTDGNPLEIQTQVKQLFIKGKNVSLDDKQKRLYEKYENRP